MLSLLAGTLPRCGSASALRVLTPSLLYSVFIWARASEKRLVIVLRTGTSQGRASRGASPEDSVRMQLIEESWLAGEDHYVVHEKKGRGSPSIFKLRDVQSTGDSRIT
ncbi:hypothetical protein Pelo_8284 [Pelomyxa schiedti]|nr:hypothetical protein Pelo_8284 [Pelomyxa schiedti]